ncbi:MAG: hypothetical protein QCH96_01065 [Candidatus Thermoplasmatota archaeon]|nr:hypothetical protein [Candidatus Thermoplasmatota archaeon]
MVKKQNLMVTIALVVIIIVALSTLIYVNLPVENNDDTQNDQGSDGTIDSTDQMDEIKKNMTCSLVFGDQVILYDLLTLETFEQYTGSGQYIKTKLLPDTVSLSEVINFTGIDIQTLLGSLNGLPTNYSIKVTASDDFATEYTIDDMAGNVDIYNENGTIIENASAVVMILAYMEEESYYFEIDPEEDIGPFRIAFVEENTPITSSSLWTKNVISIEILPSP